jgi:hypothetical protein
MTELQQRLATLSSFNQRLNQNAFAKAQNNGFSSAGGALSTAGQFIPGPVGAGLQVAGATLGVVGSAFGKAQQARLEGHLQSRESALNNAFLDLANR